MKEAATQNAENARTKNTTAKIPAMTMIILKVLSSIAYGSSAMRENAPPSGSEAGQ
jgi:hypothetical protein